MNVFRLFDGSRRPRAAGLGVALALASILASAPARARADSDAPVAADPIFKALTIGGETLAGRVRAIRTGGDVVLVSNEGQERVVPFDQLVKLSRDGQTPILTPEASVVLFPDGDRLCRTSIGSASDTTLDVQSYSLGALSIPLESLLGVIFTLPQEAEVVHETIRKVREEPRASEVLWLANNDRVAAGLLGLSDKSVAYQADKRKQSIDRTRVVAIGFDPKLVSYPRPRSAHLEVTLTDGSRIGISDARFERGQILAKARFGASIKIPIAEVVRVHALSDRIIYLPDRTPARELNVAYVGPTQPMRRNLNVDGMPLRLKGEEFDRGLGTTSRTLLAYRIEPGDARFQATVGMDDRAGPLGSATFRVLVDGKERHASPRLAAGDLPNRIDVDLTGGRLLILITEFGDRGGVRDLGDWVEARIVKTPIP